jgi:hypothetical protein
MFGGFAIVLVIAFIAKGSGDEPGFYQPPDKNTVPVDEVRENLRLNFSQTTWYGHIVDVVADGENSVRVETDLYAKPENADTARTICGATATSGLVDNVIVRGPDATSLWICNSGGFSEQGSGYPD